MGFVLCQCLNDEQEERQSAINSRTAPHDSYSTFISSEMIIWGPVSVQEAHDLDVRMQKERLTSQSSSQWLPFLLKRGRKTRFKSTKKLYLNSIIYLWILILFCKEGGQEEKLNVEEMRIGRKRRVLKSASQKQWKQRQLPNEDFLKTVLCLLNMFCQDLLNNLDSCDLDDDDLMLDADASEDASLHSGTFSIYVMKSAKVAYRSSHVNRRLQNISCQGEH